MLQGTNFANSLALNIASSISETGNNSDWTNRVRRSNSMLGLLTTLQENQAYIDALMAGTVTLLATATGPIPATILAAISVVMKLTIPVFSEYRERIAEETLLKKFANEGRLELVKLAIDSGVDINCPNYDSEITDLNVFDIGKGFFEAAGNVLLFSRRFESDTWQKSWMGSSPLMLAADNGHLAVVKYLVEKNADLNMASKSSMWEKSTALDWATKKGHHKVESYLMSKNARRESTIPSQEALSTVRAAMRP